MSEFPVGIEQQLAKIADKAALKAWIDSLPDGVKGVVIVELPNDPEQDLIAHYRYREIGDITLAESLYATKSYEHYLFDHTKRGLE